MPHANSIIRAFVYMGILLILQACQTSPTRAPAQIEDLSLNNPAVLERTLAQAVALLETGQVRQAEKKLDEILAFNSRHARAKRLKQQLHQSTQQLFNSNQFFDYRVKPGESLAMIAKRLLGDADFFVILARINRIKSPLSIKPGRIIKIPLTQQNARTNQQLVRSQANLKMLQKMLANNRSLKLLERSTKIFFTDADRDQVLKLQKQAITKLKNSHRTDESRAQLEMKLRDILQKSKNDWAVAQLKKYLLELEHSLLYRQSQQLAGEGKFLAAAKKLVKAKRFDPERAKLPEIKKLQEDLINRLHASAIIAYRKQQLEDALIRWQTILHLKPDNKIAQKYHTRTRKLLEKLKQI